MKKLFPGLGVIGILLVSPAWADKWDTYYNMATFGAGGGADAGGWFNFECADEESGFSTAGQPYFTLRIGEEFNRKKLTPDKTITFWVDDGLSYVLPMRWEAQSTVSLVYDYSAETLEEMQDFIAALRRGDRATAWSGEQQLASVALDGSYAALEFVEGCIAGEP